MPSANVETLVQTAPPVVKTANGNHVVHRQVRSRPFRKTLNAVVMRAGTSKGLFLRLEDLPAQREDWTPIILAAMGSPDPYMKQLDGMGGGVSTQSKVAVVSRSTDPNADVDYLFIQGEPGYGTESLRVSWAETTMISAGRQARSRFHRKLRQHFHRSGPFRCRVSA